MRRRVVAVAILAGLLPSAGLSQERGIAVAPGITHTPLPASQFSPEVSAPPPAGSQSGGDLFVARPGTYAPRYDQPQPFRRGRRSHATWPHGVGVYSTPFAPLPVLERPLRAARQSGTHGIDGYLRLRVTPPTARVLVDSHFVGTVDEVASRAGGLALAPGVHRVRIEAAGFETESIEVEIVAGQFVNHVRDLARLPASPAAPVRAAAPKPFYVIPGCYAGDSPPQEDRLPDGCLVANLRMVPPTLGRISTQ